MLALGAFLDRADPVRVKPTVTVCAGLLPTVRGRPTGLKVAPETALGVVDQLVNDLVGDGTPLTVPHTPSAGHAAGSNESLIAFSSPLHPMRPSLPSSREMINARCWSRIRATTSIGLPPESCRLAGQALRALG